MQTATAVELDAAPPRDVQLALSRAFDLVVAASLAILLSPVLLVVAVAVKVSSRGPVLFAHARVGRHGEMFRVIKFRTMEVGTDAEVLSDPEQRARYEANGFKLDPDDPRITWLGRGLRKLSLDELPQLLNVLLGQMSMVGVRPVRDVELALRSPADQALYLSMRPGMTGLWQVEGRSSLEDQDRFDLDRTYVERWSLWRDLVHTDGTTHRRRGGPPARHAAQRAAAPHRPSQDPVRNGERHRSLPRGRS